MNQVIKFRGKRKGHKEFIYGDLKIFNGEYYIGFEVEEHCIGGVLPKYVDYLVDKETVGQLTNLEDKEDKPIYQGDKIKFHYFFASGGIDGFVEAEHELTGIVEYGTFGWGVIAIKGEHWRGYTGYEDGDGESNIMDLMCMNESGIHEESFEVIGNIHECKS